MLSPKQIRSSRSQILRRGLPFLFLLASAMAFTLALGGGCAAQTKRIVLIKVDGLPYDSVDEWVRKRDPQTGKSFLPWFDHIFYRNGTRLENFYVRGISLSAPSWSQIDTGQHAQIKGNVEFDRAILYDYDYLNVLDYYLKQVKQKNVDMPATEVLDSLGVRLLMDAFDDNERLPGPQLFQRGARLQILQHVAQDRLLKHPGQLMGAFIGDFDMRNAITDEVELELIEKLKNPRIRYLDLMTSSFDHQAHANNTAEAHLAALREIDSLIGRIWIAIQNSSLAEDTTMIVVSDHGINSVENVYSQGFNLVKLLGSAAGGGHHVVTKRRLLKDYSIKGFYPITPLITTTTSASYYLKGQSTDYPTALLNLDGNEHAALHLRNNRLNILHVLLQRLQHKGLNEQTRKALTNLFFETLSEARSQWQRDLDDLEEELGAVRRAIEKQKVLWRAQPRKFSDAEREIGKDDAARRVYAQLLDWVEKERGYSAYLAAMRKLFSLRREEFDPSRIKIEEVIPKRAMGVTNSIYDLQNYVAGFAPNGPVLNDYGSVDLSRSFIRTNYFELLQNQTVRSNVQAGVSNHPIDFTAIRIPRDLIVGLFGDDLRPDEDVVWIYGGRDKQALVLARNQPDRQLLLRYVPVANLKQDKDGRIHFERIDWKPGLPLRIFEDRELNIPGDSRDVWLNEWHSDIDWLHALHRTQYANGLIGLHEELTLFPVTAIDASPGLTEDERLLRRFAIRQRRLVDSDMFVEGSDHWNFNVREFNSGGNHGSFLRISTHATLMFAGGERTAIPRGAVVEEPYDNLSVTPTILTLTGHLNEDSSLSENLTRRGFRKFPGRVIREVLASGPASPESARRSRQ
jgi:Type I phosphodiesterase / nucleotide pyrophosphatase